MADMVTLETYREMENKKNKRIEELEKENEMLKGDLELWESGGCRATNLFECGVVKELKQQIEQMKCDVNANIKWADENKNNQMYFKLNAIFNQWEMKENE